MHTSRAVRDPDTMQARSIPQLLDLIGTAARLAEGMRDPTVSQALEQARSAMLRSATTEIHVAIDLANCRVSAQGRFVELSPALLAVVCALAAHPRGLAQDSLWGLSCGLKSRTIRVGRYACTCIGYGVGSVCETSFVLQTVATSLDRWWTSTFRMSRPTSGAPAAPC